MRTNACRVLAVAVASAALAGCSGSGSGGGHAAGPSGIRGTDLPTFSCQATPDGTARRVAPADVIALRVCPVVAPSPFNQPPSAVTLTEASPGFANLLKALSLPDLPRGNGVLCPEYADLIQPVLARTSSRVLLVHLPVDGCDHTLAAVRSALTAVINSTSPTPAGSGTL